MPDATNRPVVFAAFANDATSSPQHLRNLAEEARCVREALAPAEAAGLCLVDVRYNVTAGEVFDAFARYRDRIAIFHFGGHADSYRLMLQNRQGQVQAAYGEGLAQFLGQQQGLRLVFLNGCCTHGHADGLRRDNGLAVIATSRAIRDDVATDLAGRFYKSLGSGASLGAAYREAVGAVLTERGSQPGALYCGRELVPVEVLSGGHPWQMQPDDDDWSLPEATADPLFGLPELPALDFPERPFQYLDYFRRSSARVFFGRGYEVRELYHKVTDEHESPLVLLYGQSGVGKSSLLDAGLLPRLEGRYEVRYLRRLRELGLTEMLRVAMLPEVTERMPLSEAWREKERVLGKPLVLVLDQVEEAFTRPNADLPKELPELLGELRTTFLQGVRPQGKLILGFRKEWLPEIDKAMAELNLPRTKVFLDRLSERGVREAILLSEDARRHYGLTVEEGLAEAVARDLVADAGSAIGPTLQVLLSTMWDAAKKESQSKPCFDEALYSRLRKLGLGLGEFLDRQMGRLKELRPRADASGLALDVLNFHTTELATAEQRTEADLREAYGHVWAEVVPLLQACKDTFLLTDPSGDKPDPKKPTRLAHDTLAPLVRRRFDRSDLPGQRARRILGARSRDWEGATAMGEPLDEADLAVVEKGASGMRGCTEAEKKLVGASQERRNASRRQRIASRLVLLAAFVLILAFGIVAEWQRRRANQLAEDTQNALYAANMSLVGQAAGEGNYEQARRLLARYLPTAEGTDRRDLRWRYLWATCHRDERTLKHSAKVSGVAYFPDGALAAVTGEWGRPVEVRVWSVKGAVTPTELPGGTGAVCLAVSGEGVAAVGLEDGTVTLWDVHSGTFTSIEAHAGKLEGAVRAVAFSADGKLLASASDDGTVATWDAHSHEKRRTFGRRRDPAVRAVAFSPDGADLASGGDDNKVRLWTLATGALKASFDEKEVRAVAFSRDGRWLASASSTGEVTLWDLRPERRGGQIKSKRDVTLKGHAGEVYSLAFSADSKTLASGGEDGSVRLWDLDHGAEAAVLEGHSGAVRSVAFSPDGSTLASGSDDREIRLWSLQKRDTFATFRQETFGMALSPAGTQFATVSRESETVTLRDLGSDRSTELTLKAPAGNLPRKWANSVAYSPVDHRLAVGYQRGMVAVWDLNDPSAQSQEFRARLTSKGEPIPVWCVAYSPDGKALATGDVYGAVTLWDAVTGTALLSCQDRHNDAVRCVAFSQKGGLFASGGKDRTVVLWKVRDGSLEYFATLANPNVREIITVSFSPEGDRLASGDDRGNVTLWDLRPLLSKPRKETKPTLCQGHAGKVNGVAFSPRGDVLVSVGGDRKVRLWNPRTGDNWGWLSGHGDSVTALSFSKDGNRLASCGWDGVVRLWHAANEKEVVTRLEDRAAQEE